MSDPTTDPNLWAMLGEYFPGLATLGSVGAAIYAALRFVLGKATDKLAGLFGRALDLVEFFKPHVLGVLTDHRKFVQTVNERHEQVTGAINKLADGITNVQRDLQEVKTEVAEQGQQIQNIHGHINRAVDATRAAP